LSAEQANPRSARHPLLAAHRSQLKATLRLPRSARSI